MRNAGGLSFRVLPDRGMGLYDLQFHGVPVSFMSGAGAVHPAYTDPAGMGWLDTWPGGFMTTCGLTQVGSPCVDEGEELGLHGRIASIPSGKVSWGAEWQDNDYVLWVEGSLRETVPFAQTDLLLRRRIWTTLESTHFWVEDRVENLGFNPTPHMFLQHF